MKIDLAKASTLLLEADSIIITSHLNPDGDALGSALGLMKIMEKQGKKVRVIVDDDIRSNLNILPNIECVERIEDGKKYVVDLLVVLDVEIKRTGRVSEVVSATKVLNIDHHRTNDEAAEYLYLDFWRAATAEIIYELAKEMKVELDEDTSLCLYTAIATDTGFFRFSNTSPYTMRVAADLLEVTGKRPNYIAEAIDRKDYAEVLGQARLVKDTELLFAGKLALIVIDKNIAQEIPSTEGILQTVLSIDGVRLAVFIKWNEEDKHRISMRSKDIDVSLLSQKLGGGGHRRAAGATINKPFDEAKSYLIEIIGQEFE